MCSRLKVLNAFTHLCFLEIDCSIYISIEPKCIPWPIFCLSRYRLNCANDLFDGNGAEYIPEEPPLEMI